MKPEKIEFDDFLKTITMFWIDGELETKIQEEVDVIVEELGAKLSSIGEKDGLKNYIRTEKNALNNILSFLGVSEERFKRIISMIRRDKGYTFSSEWSLEKTRKNLCENDVFMEDICELLMNGANSERFMRKIPKYYRDSFMISKANLKQLTNKASLVRMAKKQIETKYNTEVSNSIGRKIEETIKLTCGLEGLTYEKNEEIILLDQQFNYIIPGLKAPKVVINYSYNITTASTQTNYKNKAALIRNAIATSGRDITFVNILEGAGWIGRQSDLRDIYTYSDYLLNMNSIGMLDLIIRESVGEL